MSLPDALHGIVKCFHIRQTKLSELNGWVADWLISDKAFFVMGYLRNTNVLKLKLHVCGVGGRLMLIAFIPKICGCFQEWTWISFSWRVCHQHDHHSAFTL